MNLYNKFRKRLPNRTMTAARKFYYFKTKTYESIYNTV